MAHRLANLGRRIIEFIDPERLVNKYNASFLWNGSSTGDTNLEDNQEVYIQEGYNINPFVYSIIKQQATKTASIPFTIKKIDDERAKSKIDILLKATNHDLSIQQKARISILQSKAFSDESLPMPMIQPNITQTWTEFLALYKTFLKLTGNVYIYMLSPEDGANQGVPIQMYILPSQMVQIVVKQEAQFLTTESPIQGYLLTYGRGFLEFPAEKVIHCRYSNPNYDQNGSQLYGQSPLRAALKNIESSNSALNLNIKTLKSGGAFGLIHGKNLALTPTQAASIKDRLKEMNDSPEDLARIAGVSAEVGFTRLSLTSDELKPFDYLNFDQNRLLMS
jgi:phage portal protein BeeE